VGVSLFPPLRAVKLGSALNTPCTTLYRVTGKQARKRMLAKGVPMKRHFIAAAVTLMATTVAGLDASLGARVCTAPMPCISAMGLNYICNLGRPEDFVWIPNTKYIITGGSVATGGWGLIDTETKTVAATRSQPAQARPENLSRLPGDAGCQAADRPWCRDPAHPDGGAFHLLHRDAWFPFESVQVFSLDARGACRNCIGRLRPGSRQSSRQRRHRRMDGTIYNSVQLKNGAKQADYFVGKVTGGLYQWKPSDKTWRLLPGTEFAGNNGVEISKDEKEIYQAVSGSHSVEIISLADTAKAGAPGGIEMVQCRQYPLERR
jgi:hypothetical protein